MFRIGRAEIVMTPGFALLAAAAFFFDGSGLISAVVPAIAVHEMGHAAALYLCGVKVTRLELSASGLIMDYSDEPGTFPRLILAALSGPAAGLVYAYIASVAGKQMGSEFLLCSSGASVLLSAFNLLPCPPLDGGRAAELVISRVFGSKAAGTAMTALSLAVFAALSISGAALFSLGFGGALMLFGFWILVTAVQNALPKAL